jgi:hypothetical protein
MKAYDVFICDPREYGGGFEIRVTEVRDENEAKAEAIKAANEEAVTEMGWYYDLTNVGSVKLVPSADDMAESDGLGLQ